MFKSFDELKLDADGATIYAKTGGEGPPLLLLHGFPQTHVMWHSLAVELSKSYRVILPDLRGYGDSLAHDNDFTFRAMANDQIALMQHFGFSSFDVIAHDRGARVAHRLALDYSDAITSIAFLDILPTLDVWRTMDDWLAQRYYHWTFLAQPGGLPQNLIGHDPKMYLHSVLKGLSGRLDIFPAQALAEYERSAAKQSVIDAWCGDYAATATTDREHDKADEGRQLNIPCLVLWGEKGVVARHINPVDAWAAWFPYARGHSIDAGHFLVEEKPNEVLDALTTHLQNALTVDLQDIFAADLQNKEFAQTSDPSSEIHLLSNER